MKCSTSVCDNEADWGINDWGICNGCKDELYSKEKLSERTESISPTPLTLLPINPKD